MPSSMPDLQTVPMITVAAVFLFVSWISVSLRIYVRGFIIRSLGWDDWMCLLTQVLFTVMCILVFLVGSDELSFEPTHVLTGNESRVLMTYVVAIFGVYILSTITFKISLAIFFLRIVDQRWQRQVIYASAILCTIIGTSWFFLAVFQCGNPADFVANENAGKCLAFNKVLAPWNYLHGILNTITDWTFAMIPIHVVRKAKISTRAKASVIGILVLGVAGSITSLARLAYIHVLGEGYHNFYTKAPPLAITSIIELGFGITAASMATLRPLLARCMNAATNIMSTSRGKTSRRDTATPTPTPTHLSTDHGIVMERSIDVAYERQHAAELVPLPSNRLKEGWVSGKQWSVTVDDSQPDDSPPELPRHWRERNSSVSSHGSCNV
ncbi:hypothetical protein BDV97DRAFT_137031 [Delphinella strobiligena]|nr:hypothetical protein BDV97DRAFT_137031 [Delphinella strobiligena]